MDTLSYGFKKPQSGDNGSIFWTALEDDIQQLNDHTHNGTNSAKLTASAITVVTQAISSASWVATTGGTYRQSVTITGGLQYDDIAITMKDSSGNPLYLTIEKINASQYYVYINDNTMDVTAVYGI
jgi:hypothetical protein